MKKSRLFYGLLMLAMCFIFTACGSEAVLDENTEQGLQESRSDTGQEEPEIAEKVDQPDEQKITQTPVAEETEIQEPVIFYGDYRDIQDEVYRELIKGMMDVGAFPETSGVECEGAFYENHYAVMDIDGDGQEELLIDFANADYMAAMALYIYDYDRETKEIYIEFAGYPEITVYDHGYLREEASHNHGRSNLDDFWPYRLWKYNAEEDQYELIADMDAWQKQIYDDVDPDPEFPDEKDTDGDGIVYYAYSSYGEPEMIMDHAEYEAWCEQYQSENIKEIQWNLIISEEFYYELYPTQAVG